MVVPSYRRCLSPRWRWNHRCKSSRWNRKSLSACPPNIIWRLHQPTIIKPFFGDQAFWAERVESLNVGSAVRKLTTDHLADALRTATQDSKQIAKAKVVGEMIRKECGVAVAIESIYRDLEYAKSIIKPPPEDRDNKLNRPTSLLHPITTGHLLGRARSGSESSTPASRARSRVKSDASDRASDASWDVLSGDDH